MQPLGLPRREELIFILICCVFIVSWKLFVGLWKISRLSSITKIHEVVTRTNSKEPTKNYSVVPWESSKRPSWDFQAEGNQFLTSAVSAPAPASSSDDENERNYNDFVPNCEARSRVNELTKTNTNVGKCFTEEVLESTRELFLTTARDASKSKGIRKRTVEGRSTSSGPGNETTWESFPAKPTNPRVKAEISFYSTVERSKPDVVEEIKIPVQLIYPENSRSFAARNMDESENKFTKLPSKTISESGNKNSRLELRMHDRKIEIDTPPRDGQDYPKHESAMRLVIGESDLGESFEQAEKNCESELRERSKIADDNVEETSAPSTLENYCSKARVDGQQLGEKLIVLEANARRESTELSKSERRETEEEAKSVVEKYEIPFHTDEGNLEMDPGGYVETRSWKEANYPDEQIEVFSEKGRDYTEEISIIRSHTNGARTRGEEKEDEEFGSTPDADTWKNALVANNCTGSLVQSPTKSDGKEEADLNTIIRRMIVTELMKHREWEEGGPRRVYSDTESVLTRNKNERRNRTVRFNIENQGFLGRARDVEDETEGSKSGSFGNLEIIELLETQNISLESKNRNSSYSDAGKSVNGNSTGITCPAACSGVPLERKGHFQSLVNGVTTATLGTGKRLAMDGRKDVSRSTQTEHIYVIRGARSCPFRGKRGAPLYAQLHRLTSHRGGAASRTVYASRDFSDFVFRKASDNLIYEKGKASCSPSYIPCSERFRWRYVTPRKMM